MSDLNLAVAACAMVIEVAAVVFVACRISGWACREDDGWTARLVVGLVIGVTQIVGVELLCGAVVALYAPVVLSAHVIIAAVARRQVPRSEGWRAPRLDRRPFAVLLVGVLAFVGTIALLLTLKAVPIDSDDTTYHLPNAASWVQVHDLWHLPATNPGYLTNGYPSDGELVVSWLMQLFRGAELTGIPNLVYAGLILAAAGLLAKELGGRPSAGVLPAAALILTPISWTTQVPTALTDWMSLGGLLAGVALVLHGRHRAQWRWPVLAGLALGLGVGSKDTAVIPCIGVLVLAILIYPRPSRRRLLTILIGGVISLAGIWFIRNAIQAGNPIYPEPVAIGGTTLLRGGVGPFTADSTSLLHDLGTAGTAALRTWLDWMRELVGIPLILVAAVVLSFQRRYRSTMLQLCAGLAILWFISYLATPYTGPREPTWMSGAQIRYGFPALFLGAVCACVAARWLLSVAWASFVFDLYHILSGSPSLSFPPPGAPPDWVIAVSLGVTVVAMSLLLLASKGGRRQLHLATWRAHRAAACVAGGLAVAAVALAVAHEEPVPNPLDRALSSAGRPAGPVMIIGDIDAFAAVGYDLRHHLVSAGGGGAPHQVPLMVPEQLNDRVASVHPPAIVVGPLGNPGVIPGWRPEGYRLLYTFSVYKVYIAVNLPPTSHVNTARAAIG